MTGANVSRLGGRAPALDGLRGVAVTGVVLFHSGVGGLPGGYLGVDVFFVLSGYLITALLLEEHGRTGRIALGSFWARRVRRLFPALLVLIMGVLVARRAFDPAVLPRLPGDAVAAVLDLSNWRQIGGSGGYFAAGAPPSPLQHTWSLSVEEQFYVLWPAALLVLARRRRLVLVAAAVGAAASAVLMAVLWSPTGGVTRLYFGTDTRAQDLLVGATLAAVLDRGRLADRWRWPLVGSLGAVVLVVAALRLPGQSRLYYQGGCTVVALATAAVLAGVLSEPRAPLARMLSWRPLTALGGVSYALYLWHWPIIQVLTGATTGLRGPALLGVRVAAALAAATASTLLVERPFRRGPAPAGRHVLIAAPAVAAVVVFAMSVGTPSDIPPVLTSASSGPTAAGTDGSPAAAPSSSRGPGGATVQAVHRAAHTGPERVVVLGDSVAETLAAGLPQTQAVTVIDDGILGCGVVRGSPYRYFGAVSTQLPQCGSWPQTWAADVRRDDPDIVLVVVGRWEVMDRVLDGSWHHVGDPVMNAELERELSQAVTVAGSTGAAVAVATAPYYLRGETPSGGRFPEDDPQRVDAFNQLLRSVAATHPAVSVVDLNAALDPAGHYSRDLDGHLARYDGVHLTTWVDEHLAPWLYPQLLAAAKR